MNDERPELAQLRSQLRQLGYLDSRIERFFLADAGEPSPWFAIVEYSFKLALTAGPLLAALVLTSQVSSHPELADHFLDLILLSVYVVAGVSSVVGLAGSVVGLLLLAARRAGLLKRFSVVFWARSAGVVLGVGSLVYLSLWWSGRDGSSPMAVTALMMFLGVGIAFAVARLAILASFGILAAVAPDIRPATPSLSRFRILRYVLVGALVYAGLFVAVRSGSDPAPNEAASPYELRDSELRVLVVGIDGLSRELLDNARAAGDLPGFDTLQSRSARYDYTVEAERVPAVVWTSLATGQDPSGHGIRGMQVDTLVGLSTALPLEQSSILGRALSTLRLSEARPVDTILRRAKANWDILSDQGRSVGVVGWWASWPADPLRGFLMTDRLFFKLERGGPFEKETDSEELYYRLAESFVADRAEARVSLDPIREQAVRLAGEELALALERDAYHLLVSQRLAEEQDPQLQMIYFSGLDVAADKLFDTPSTPVVNTVASVELLRDYVSWIDRYVERLVAWSNERRVVVLVAEPGRLADPASSHGSVFLLGGPFGKQSDAQSPSDATLYDVTPTVLHLLGFPTSAEMSGRVLDELFRGGEQTTPSTRIETFGAKRIDPAALRSGFDAEMIKQLKSLGYIE